MIHGAHVILYSTDPEADRAFLRDVSGLPHVDVGMGWPIFGLPPAEVAVHPAETGGGHELMFMCEDATALTATLRDRGIGTAPVEDLRWGRLTRVGLPGGGEIGIYEPKHERPPHA